MTYKSVNPRISFPPLFTKTSQALSVAFTDNLHPSPLLMVDVRSRNSSLLTWGAFPLESLVLDMESVRYA